MDARLLVGHLALIFGALAATYSVKIVGEQWQMYANGLVNF